MSLDTFTHLELPIPPTIQQDSWQRSQDFSTPRTQWNVYLNQICLHTFLPWLQAEYEPAASALPNVWEVVNGTAIAFRHKKLILLPSLSIDTSELRVPQEWIDIPSLAGDYYLAAQVNPDDLQVRIWGYTTHEQLKTTGSYDLSDRTYCLDTHALIRDISVLWVVQQLYPDEPTQAAIAPLPAVAPTQTENLLQRLATANAQTRLELPFELWGALLESETWQRYQLRQGSTASRSPVGTITNLNQWFQNAFSASWQALENILSTEELAFSLRQAPALSTAVQRVKILDLPQQSILLIVALNAEADDRSNIRVQLRPLDRPLCLPAHLKLSLLSSTGATIQSVQTRIEDNSIQLQSFKCASGTRFSLEIALLDVAIVEDFVV